MCHGIVDNDLIYFQGVAGIPVERKDQRACHELRPIGKMDVAKGTTEEFVTVVSVGSQPMSENFVTVLSIGNKKRDDEETSSKSLSNGVDGHLEEEVEVFRLPGERLGFGLKFEGGNKTSERVRRLFVQSCAEQSPASRAKCSWGTLGEGDEVITIRRNTKYSAYFRLFRFNLFSRGKLLDARERYCFLVFLALTRV